MPDGQVLEFSGVTKRFGTVTAVSDLSARVEPGVVTGFLGPNGAGKTTSLRMLLGLVRPTSGMATIGGQAYAHVREPLRTVGAALEASSFHPGRSGANHLRVSAQAARIPLSRVDEVLGLVGLADAAGRKVGGYSLGMRQRLGLATALLGDPGVLVLDEPANGLDPEGIRWMRGLLRTLAEEGRTVLISSHLLAEVQQTVDALLIIANGSLVFQGGIEELAEASDHATVVDAPDRPALMAALERAGHAYDVLRNGLTVRTAEPDEVGAIAAAAGVALSSLQRRGATLEDVFLGLVSGTVHLAGSAAAAASGADEASGAEAADTGPQGPVDEPAAVAGTALATLAPAADADARPQGASAAPEARAADRSPARAEPPTSTASFAVASTGVIDIVPPATDDEAWLDDRRATPDAVPGSAAEGADDVIAAPDEPAPGDPDAAPETATDGPAPLAWRPEPMSSPEDRPDEEGDPR
jgi:ABC-2 type transport system ATP-binding protein